MNLHVLGLPHTQTTRAYGVCAFTSLVRQFSTMMHHEGHNVTLYAGDENEAECSELVQVTTRATQDDLFGKYDWYQRGEVYGVDWDERRRYWRHFIGRCIDELRERSVPGDIVCIPSGWTMRNIMEAVPDRIYVEPMVGYSGIACPYRVFPSYAWMAAVYGEKMGAAAANGSATDEVIPHFLDPDAFSPGNGDGDYALFLSRMVPRKGYGIAIAATANAGVELLIGGVGGDRPEAEHVHYMGFADELKRTTLLRNARCLMCPTLYLEAFGLVVAEALMCGTPVITTDWGAFPELVEQGVDGFRCRHPDEFVQALHDVAELDRWVIRQRALARFSTDVIAPRYTAYFERLQSLNG